MSVDLDYVATGSLGIECKWNDKGPFIEYQ